MAEDRNTTVTNKKSESNSCFSEKLHIRRETVWKVVKKFKETGNMQPTWPGQKTNSQNEASGENYEGKIEKEFTSFCCKNGCRSRNQSNVNASNPQRRPQNQSLQNAEKA